MNDGLGYSIYLLVDHNYYTPTLNFNKYIIRVSLVITYVKLSNLDNRNEAIGNYDFRKVNLVI